MCDQLNPCGSCSSCSDTCNPYEDCGCLNPTTFDCLTKPPLLQYIPVSSDMTGTEVLKSIDEVVGALQQSIQDINNPTSNTSDVRVKASSTDTISGFLSSKIVKGDHTNIALMAGGANEFLRVSVTPKTLVSTRANNLLSVGTDNLLYVNAAGIAPAAYLREGVGITITGSNTPEDPYIITAAGFIQAKRPCFDGVWKDFVNNNTSNPDVTLVSSSAKYRVRHDGSIEFKGNATYTVAFSEYTGSKSKFTITAGGLSVACLTLAEQIGVAHLKGATFIDTPQTAADQITQMFGYIVRKSSKDIQIEFQSSFSNPTTKTVVVSFDGITSHPTI
jgi:hypothetical protein